MGQINTNNYPTVESLADADLLIVENLTNGTGTTTPKQLKENAIGTDPLQTTSQTVTGAINELKSRIDGGGSYSAGAGINIANNVITNIRRGALPGVIDEITSGGYAHTQINNAFDSITAGGLVVLKTEASGTANTVRIQYGEQASQSQAYRLCDTDLEYATINVSVGDTIILMFDDSGYRLIVLSVLSNSGGGSGDSYAGLGVGKMVSFTSNVIDTDIDLHRAPMAGDRLLIWFNTTIQNPTSLTTYNNGTAVTSNLETVSPLLYNAGWNVVEFMNDGLLYNNVWVRKQNVPIPNNTLSGLDDTAISVNPTDGQVLTFNSVTGKWGNQNPSGGVAESVVGPVENGTTASQAYAVGEHFIRNDKFCTCISAIASGATLTQGTNYVEGTIAEALNGLSDIKDYSHIVSNVSVSSNTWKLIEEYTFSETGIYALGIYPSYGGATSSQPSPPNASEITYSNITDPSNPGQYNAYAIYAVSPSGSANCSCILVVKSGETRKFWAKYSLNGSNDVRIVITKIAELAS
ncbi:MAG: hypothetical protein IIZ09_03215 [Ruminococcus sp.]|nr:hypothetical protein [Ruminococcus sp.]